MSVPIVLASTSKIRATLLQNANVAFAAVPPRVDEAAVKAALIAQGEQPRNIADALAELKATKISVKSPEAFVIGSDQVLDHNGQLLSKADSPDAAVDQLKSLRGNTHRLFSAAVICQGGRPIWRHVGRVNMRMRNFSDTYLEHYVSRNWERIRYSVGSYNLEEEGVRLFAAVEGDYFTVLGMPLLETLNYLAMRGALDT